MNSYNGFSGAQRAEAQRWLNEQYAAGTLARPSKCVFCGQTDGPIDAHAEDYSKPFGPHLSEFPACYVCHMMIHCRFGSGKGPWNAYRAMIRAGYKAEPHGRDFGRIRRFLGGGAIAWIAGPAPDVSPLDSIGEPPPTDAGEQGTMG